jgi:hypothetical protein
MPYDPTQTIRQAMLAAGVPQEHLETANGPFPTEDLRRDYTVHAFLAPFVVVTRKSDGVRGTLEFTHNPRWYFNFVED